MAIAAAGLACAAVSEVKLGDGPFNASADASSDTTAVGDAPDDVLPESADDALVNASDGAPTDADADACSNALDPACAPFGAPELIEELSSGPDNGYDENPTLTSDMLEIYFSSTRDGGPGHGDVWRSVRDSGDAAWSPPTLVENVSSSSKETSPAVTFDGLHLYVGSDRDGGQGGLDIWMSSRPDLSSDWPPPAPVSELNSPGDEIPRPLGDDSLAMPMSYRASSSVEYQIYMTYRTSATTTWTAPALLPWADTSNLDVDGFLSDDALSFAFSSDRLNGSGLQDLFFASLPGPLVWSGTPVPLTTLNTAAYNEADPWLSPDLHDIYFSSNRSGTPRIYHATR
ncbi:MAG: hypothetical protein ABTD50_02320 [Polyangiaceae bacterium]